MPDASRRGLTAVSLPVVASLVCGGIAGLCGFTVHYAEGLSYLSSDPLACVNCHVMQDQYDGWQKAGHHTAATCSVVTRRTISSASISSRRKTVTRIRRR